MSDGQTLTCAFCKSPVNSNATVCGCCGAEIIYGAKVYINNLYSILPMVITLVGCEFIFLYIGINEMFAAFLSVTLAIVALFVVRRMVTSYYADRMLFIRR